MGLHPFPTSNSNTGSLAERPTGIITATIMARNGKWATSAMQPMFETQGLLISKAAGVFEYWGRNRVCWYCKTTGWQWIQPWNNVWNYLQFHSNFSQDFRKHLQDTESAEQEAESSGCRDIDRWSIWIFSNNGWTIWIHATSWYVTTFRQFWPALSSACWNIDHLITKKLSLRRVETLTASYNEDGN